MLSFESLVFYFCDTQTGCKLQSPPHPRHTHTHTHTHTVFQWAAFDSETWSSFTKYWRWAQAEGSVRILLWGRDGAGCSKIIPFCLSCPCGFDVLQPSTVSSRLESWYFLNWRASGHLRALASLRVCSNKAPETYALRLDWRFRFLPTSGLQPYSYFQNNILRWNSHFIQLTHLKCTIQWLLVYLWNHATITTIDFTIFQLPP